MSSEPTAGRIRLSFEGNIAVLTIDRQSARNALSLDMWRSIPELIARVESHPDVVAVVIRGAGDTAFAAGADISDLRASLCDPRAGREHLDAIGSAERSIANCRRVTIARISGYCIGGGLEIAMACDLRFASTSSTLATPPTSLGVAYSLNSTRRLIELVGVSAARDLLFTARRIDGPTALRLGLVDSAVPAAELDQAIEDYCGRLAHQSQYAIRLTKLVIAQALDRPVETAALEQLRVDSFSGADLQEGVEAFEDRRPPTFTSRWLE
ncbi:enoyl-CoA hydratase/isomerase family protein [Nocardioides panzhihuensis]|uniref:Enoyl-CoA hydratase/carnithine racemase n=1 Tax=Nocardioides panzhihuensis TaxID=860243 RepID=A0A7Z0DJW8_9ACTN|nr:enoyl-CoA hydratase-related protein [Nocardioides panzhihuensis]NYI76755.1 enoyl-CoA hydratase/carnithine racemase [Nocardioides panzhihuensis]